MEQLVLLGRGDLAPVEATRAVKHALSVGKGLGENIYAALRDLAWRIIASREYGADLGHWFHVVEHAGTALLATKQDRLAARVDVLADLLHQSAAFARRQPLEQVLHRKHVGAILGSLGERGRESRREELRKESGLSDPNLSRVLSLLEGHNLIKRHRSGKEMIFELTRSGKDAARSLGRPSAPTTSGETSQLLTEHFALPVGYWDDQGQLCSANSASWDLARELGAEAAIKNLSTWRSAIEAASSGVRGDPGSETWLVRIGNARWFDVSFSPSTASGTTFFASDVTSHKQKESEHALELQALREGLSRAKKQIAEVEERYFAYSRTVSRIRDILNTALHLIGARRDHPRIVARPDIYAAPQTSHEQVDALQYLTREFLMPPEVGESSQEVDVAAFVEQTMKSMEKAAGWAIKPDLHHLRGVRVPASTARHMVTQLLFAVTKPGATPGGSLTANVEQEVLILRLNTYRDAVSPALIDICAFNYQPMRHTSFAHSGTALSGYYSCGETTYDGVTVQAAYKADQAEIGVVFPTRVHGVR